MTPVIYDGSFSGLLSAIFEVYEYKIADARIAREINSMGSLFAREHKVISSDEKARRVWAKLQEKLSRNAENLLYKAYLSEDAGIENTILRYVQYVLRSKQAVENDYSNKDVLTVQQISKKVHREKHRMEAFVRFQLTKDGLYYALVQPDFNVLPLISKHFKDRYADQRWMIYDTRRRYGIYYDLQEVSEIEMEFTTDSHKKSVMPVLHDECEDLYQALWKQYFASVNIKARKNLKLHIKHMPKRYWKYLIEKKHP